MMKLIDTHAHLYLPEFDEDRRQVIQNALDRQIEAIFLPNIDHNSVESMLALHHQFPKNCFPMLGLHPCDVKPDYELILDDLEKKLINSQVKFWGIGETGTDAYWDTSYMTEQVKSFEKQIQWALTYNLPIIIHSRETLDKNIDIIAQYQSGSLRGIFHCFGGNYEHAKKIMDLNFHMGIGGTVTYKNSGLSDVLPNIGLSHIVLETDSPFLSPVPYRGKRNESKHILEIANYIAQIMGCSLESVAELTTRQAKVVFGLD